MEEIISTNAKRRGGRPKKAIRKESATGVRFSKTEYFIVKQKAAKAGMKITAYIRLVAVEGKVLARLSDIEKQQLKC